MSSGMTRRRGARTWFARAAQVAALCLVAAGWAAAQSPKAAPHCTPVSGSVMTNFNNAGTATLGTATGDLRGALSATLTGPPRPLPDGTTIFSVQHHWVTEAGDTVEMDVADATAKEVAPGLYAIVRYIVPITDGTGRFAGAEGSVENIGAVDLTTQPWRTVFRYQGTVCFPAPGR